MTKTLESASSSVQPRSARTTPGRCVLTGCSTRSTKTGTKRRRLRGAVEDAELSESTRHFDGSESLELRISSRAARSPCSVKTTTFESCSVVDGRALNSEPDGVDPRHGAALADERKWAAWERERWQHLHPVALQGPRLGFEQLQYALEHRRTEVCHIGISRYARAVRIVLSSRQPVNWARFGTSRRASEQESTP
jgi:hypothetical protein